MLKIIEKHHTFKELVGKSGWTEASWQPPGTVTAAAYSLRRKSLVFSVGDGRVFRREFESGRDDCICKTADALCAVAFDCSGRLVYASAERACIERSYYSGEAFHRVVDGYQDHSFHKLGAISIHSNGMIYFPDCGEDGQSAIYFANPIGLVAVRAGTDAICPTAVCCSADNRFLYIGESSQGYVTKFNIKSDGTLEYKRIHCFLDPEHGSRINSMIVDEEDNLYVVTDAGIHVYAVGGMLLGVIETQRRCTAACFGGDDLHDLYIFCEDCLYTMGVNVGKMVN